MPFSRLQTTSLQLIMDHTAKYRGHTFSFVCINSTLKKENHLDLMHQFPLQCVASSFSHIECVRKRQRADLAKRRSFKWTELALKLHLS